MAVLMPHCFRALFGPLGGRQWGVEGEEWGEGRGRGAVSDGEEEEEGGLEEVWGSPCH